MKPLFAPLAIAIMARKVSLCQGIWTICTCANSDAQCFISAAVPVFVSHQSNSSLFLCSAMLINKPAVWTLKSIVPKQ